MTKEDYDNKNLLPYIAKTFIIIVVFLVFVIAMINLSK